MTSLLLCCRRALLLQRSLIVKNHRNHGWAPYTAMVSKRHKPDVEAASAGAPSAPARSGARRKAAARSAPAAAATVVASTKPAKKPRGKAKTAHEELAGSQTAAAEAAQDTGPQYFLFKSEPSDFSIDALEAQPKATSEWDGVRNFQARNIMQGMRVGDQAFFYHSNCKTPAIVGVVEVVQEAYPDSTAWDPKSKYYDEKGPESKPRWFMVDIKLVRKLQRSISLEELKAHKEGGLAGMALLTRGRLSVQPVTPQQWQYILGLEDQPPPDA